MRHLSAEPASSSAYQLGEGPVWDAQRHRVLWVDVVEGTVLSGSLSGHGVVEESARHVDETVGAVVPAAWGGLLVAGRHDLHLVDALGNQRRLVEVVPRNKQSRLNDGACDPAGRFLVGSLAQDGRTGDECLYRWDNNGVITLDDDLTLSNGLAWSSDGTVLYSIDTDPGIVWQRSYDPASGAAGARTQVLHVTEGHPDGMCLDAEGNLWIAVWGAGEVRCYRPDGEQIATVSVAAPHTSSVAFVGPRLDLLLITTARDELTQDQLDAFPDSGRLFLVDAGVVGLPVAAWSPFSSSP
jgi:sugar lactone lactonase YvrE